MGASQEIFYRGAKDRTRTLLKSSKTVNSLPNIHKGPNITRRPITPKSQKISEQDSLLSDRKNDRWVKSGSSRTVQLSIESDVDDTASTIDSNRYIYGKSLIWFGFVWKAKLQNLASDSTGRLINVFC